MAQRLKSCVVSGLRSAIALVLLACTGCASMLPHASQSVGAICPGSTPVDIVRTFYAASARGDEASAQACLAGVYRPQLLSAVDPPWTNIASIQLTHMDEKRVDPIAIPGGLPRPTRLVLVSVTYVVQWYSITTDENGPGCSFIYVEQADAHAPWRMASIGSGP